MKLKKDRYIGERGGTAKIINISCVKCNHLLLIYQKDGHGDLKRCYLNRIIAPPEYASLQKLNLKDPNSLKNLTCICGEIIGSPINYKDGRLAFHLFRGKFRRTINKEL